MKGGRRGEGAQEEEVERVNKWQRMKGGGRRRGGGGDARVGGE